MAAMAHSRCNWIQKPYGSWVIQLTMKITSTVTSSAFHTMIRAIAKDLTSDSKKTTSHMDNTALAQYLLFSSLTAIKQSRRSSIYAYSHGASSLSRAQGQVHWALWQNKLAIACSTVDKGNKDQSALKHEVEILSAVHSLSLPKQKQRRTDPRVTSRAHWQLQFVLLTDTFLEFHHTPVDSRRPTERWFICYPAKAVSPATAMIVKRISAAFLFTIGSRNG